MKKILLAMVFILMSAACSTVKNYQDFEAHKPLYSSWEEVFKHSQDMEVIVWNTGRLKADRQGLLNSNHPEAPQWKERHGFVDVPVVLVHSYQNGNLLLDTGLDASMATNKLKHTRGLLEGVIIDETDIKKGQDVATRLGERGILPDFVFFTHLHFDHTAGAVDLPDDIHYVIGQGERPMEFPILFRTVHLDHIEQLEELNFSEAPSLPPFNQVLDVFGDSSVFAINTSGHTKGHVSYLINSSSGPVLVAGDAVNIPENLETGVGPGDYSADKKQAQIIFQQIQEFLALYPQVKLVMGHHL